MSFAKTRVRVFEFESDVKNVPLCFDLRTACFSLMGIRAKTGGWFMRERDNMYKMFAIPTHDKAGKLVKLRHIQAPQDKLKAVHQVLNGVFSKIELPENVAAYIPGKCCADSAKVHVGKKVLVGMDIKNFFNSTRRAWIREWFMKECGLNHHVSSILATVCTCSQAVRQAGVVLKNDDGTDKKVNFLPQGSPLSGYMANLVGWSRFGRKIKDFVEPKGWAFTIYSDDITLSHPEDLPNVEVDAVIAEVARLVEEAGYKINRKKTRVLRQSSQQKVLGCVVNEKLNIPRRKYQKIRCLIHNCKVSGFDSQAERCGRTSGEAVISFVRGMLQYFKQIREDRYEKLNQEFNEALAIHGKELAV